MDNFIVSARKYRPQTFDTVVGQKHITTTLKNAIENKQLAHAYLFCGPRGVGKTTCARIFAKTINCEHPLPNGEACNECHSCKSFNEGVSLNIAELDAASNNSVDDIRTLVEQVRFPPQSGKYKVYIIDEVHMLSAAAFNAFLKTLEEPPSYVIFILATTEKHKLLPTILSRCQIFDFKRITNDDTVEHLEEICEKEHVSAEKSALQIIAQKSEGCMRDALSIMDKIVSFTEGKLTYSNTLENLNVLDYEYYFKFLDAIAQQDLAAALLLYDEVNKKGFEGDIFMNGLAEFFRNLLVAKSPKAAQLLNVVDGLAERYLQAANAMDTSFILSALNILNEAEINFRMARNKRLLVEMTLIKLTYLSQAVSIAASDQQEIVKKKLIQSNRAVYRKQTIKNWDMVGRAGENTGSSNAATPAKSENATLKIHPEAAQLQQKTHEAFHAEKTAGQTSQKAENKPVVETPKPSIPNTTKNTSEAPKTATSILSGAKGGLNLQTLLKKKNKELQNAVEEKEEVLTAEKLQSVWNQYIEKLSAAHKLSAASTFRMARLRLLNDTEFSVGVTSLINQKFVEHETTLLMDDIHQAFHNRNINIHIVLEETETNETPKKYLSSQEKMALLIDKFPVLGNLIKNSKLHLQ